MKILVFLYDWFEKWATWPRLAILGIIFFACVQGFNWRKKALDDCKTLDGRYFGYSPAQARDFLVAMGERGRRLYAVTEITLDALFPLVYSTLLAVLIIRFYSREAALKLILAPILAACFDLLENFMVAYMAWNFDGRERSLAWLAAICTISKWLLLLLSFLVCLGGLLVALRHRLAG